MTFENLMFTQGFVFVFSSIRKQLITAEDDEAQDEISNSVTSTEKVLEQGVPSNHMPKEAKQEVSIGLKMKLMRENSFL